jgi:hypothetical protein
MVSMQRLLTPQSASSSGWLNPTYALVYDDDRAVLTGGGGNSYLVLSDFANRFFEGSVSIVGIQVNLDAARTVGQPADNDPSQPEATPRLEISLSLDGSTPVGAPIYVNYNGGQMVAGGITNLWGRSWTQAEIESATFTALIRRGDVLGDEATETVRRVNVCTLTVYFNYEGGSLTMPGFPRPVGSQRCVFGKETVPGTAVTPTTMLKHSKLNMNSVPEYNDIATYGSMLPEGRVLVNEIATGELQVTRPDYNELVFHVAMRLGKPVSTTVTTGVYSHVFTVDPRKLRSIWSATIQNGDFNIGEENAFTVLRSVGLDFSGFTTVSESGTAIGRPDLNLRNGGNTDSKGITGGVNTVQTIAAPTGTPTSGNVSYSFNGEKASWVYNAAAAVVQTALQALSTIGAGGATVTGTGPWVVTFAGSNAGKEQPKIEPAGHTLAGGTTPAQGLVTVTTKGGWTEYETAPVVAGKAAFYVADTYAGLAASMVSDVKQLNWNAEDDLTEDYTFAGGPLTFDRLIQKPTMMKFGFGVERSSNAFQWLTKSRDNSKVFARLGCISDQLIAAGNPYALSIDMFGQLKDVGSVEAMGEIVGKNFELGAQYSTDWGRGATITIVNAVPGSAL